MEQPLCQSCGMPLSPKNKGTNADGSPNNEYCAYCYQSGKFTQNFTMSQMIEFCLQFLDQINAQAGWSLTPIQAKEQMWQYFPQLKRWKEKDERTLTEKAIELLAQCENVTVASIDTNGYPRPVQMSKIATKDFHEVWMTTNADSAKVHDFRANNKAGLCYDHYGDSVALRGTIEVITDNEIRKKMWQDWFIHHFPGGVNDPNYVLLHFIGREATFWINGEFSHSFIHQNEITTDRLILRPWQESDAEALYKYAQDPAIGPIAGWAPHTSIEDSLHIIRTVFNAPETYAVVLKETGEPVGSIGIMLGEGLHSAAMQTDEAEIGYWIGKPYWGQGLIPEAVRRLLQRCFEDLGKVAVWCGYYDGNTKSRRVMEKCGFHFHHTEEGKVSPLGDIRTEHFMRITKKEWEQFK